MGRRLSVIRSRCAAVKVLYVASCRESVLRACATIFATVRGVEQTLSLCLTGQLYQRADALIADAALGRC